MTATAILHACLKMLGSSADFYVPHRLEEGYGVNVEAVRKILADGAQLIVTVDCGISAVEPAGRGDRRRRGRDRHRPPHAAGKPCRTSPPSCIRNLPGGRLPQPEPRRGGRGVQAGLAARSRGLRQPSRGRADAEVPARRDLPGGPGHDRRRRRRCSARTARWRRSACGACPARSTRACGHCWSRPTSSANSSTPTTWASSWRRGSTRPGGWATPGWPSSC